MTNMDTENDTNVPGHIQIERAANKGSDVILLDSEAAKALVVAEVRISMPNQSVATRSEFGQNLRRFALGLGAAKPIIHLHKWHDELRITIMDAGKRAQSDAPELATRSVDVAAMEALLRGENIRR